MKSRALRQSAVWGGVLILVGLLLLIDQFVELSPWVWVLMLAAAGLGALGLFLADRSDRAMLLATYILWAIALLLALITLDILREEALPFYVLLAIALPGLALFLDDRTQRWVLIPAYVLLVIAVMIGLVGLGLLDDRLVPTYVLFAIALPFFVVYARDRRQWWPLVAGGILAVVGLSLLIAEAAFAYVGALVLVLVGAGILVRLFTRRAPAGGAGSADADAPGPTAAEIDEPE